MGRYANSVLRLDFPDLSMPDDLIYVAIRNPKTVPVERLQPADLPLDAEGKPDMSQAMPAAYAVIAGLVIDWHVYDADDDSDDSPALPLPATVELVGKLPADILTEVMDRIKEVVTPPQ